VIEHSEKDGIHAIKVCDGIEEPGADVIKVNFDPSGVSEIALSWGAYVWWNEDKFRAIAAYEGLILARKCSTTD